MRDLKTIENQDLKSCLNDCQQRQYPFTFWDEKEVAGFNLGSLPRLTKESALKWTPKGNPFSVELTDPDSVSAFKDRARVSIEDTDKVVGFAITSIDGSRVEIQTYLK